MSSRHQKRPAQAHRLHGESFRFKPFRQQRNLRRPPRAVRAFEHEQRSAEFFQLHARKRHAIKTRRQLRSGRFSCCASCELLGGLPFFELSEAMFLLERVLYFFGANCASSTFLAEHLPHQLLQFVHPHGPIHQYEMVRFDHLVVVRQDSFLKNAKALRAVERNSQIHARFVIFQLGTAGDDAVHRHVQRRAKIKCNVRNRRETVEISQPVGRAAPGRIARERRVDIAVRQNQVAAVEKRHDLPLAAIGEIRGVQQRKCRRRQQPALFPAARGGLHQRRRIPFREMDAISADFQPALQQIELRALSRAVDSFDDDQCAGILPLRRGRFGWRWSES